MGEGEEGELESAFELVFPATLSFRARRTALLNALIEKTFHAPRLPAWRPSTDRVGNESRTAVFEFLMFSKSSVRSDRLRHWSAVLAVTVVLPTSLAAANTSNDTLTSVLGPSSMRLIGAARVVATFGTVTSGFRSVEHNRQVGGMPTSYHLVGRAIDVQRRRGVTHQMVDAALRRAGYALVESLDEGDHSHFAFAIATPSVAVTTGTTGTAGTTSVPAGTAYKPLLPNLLADDHGVLIAAGTPVSDSGNLQVEPARLPSVRR